MHLFAKVTFVVLWTMKGKKVHNFINEVLNICREKKNAIFSINVKLIYINNKKRIILFYYLIT